MVELLSPAEVPRAKLGFYRSHGVDEVLDVDVATGHARLLTRPDTTSDPAEPWAEAPASQVIPGLLIVDGAVEVSGERYR